MRKVSAVGLVIGVLFLAVVFGIASIPDEVLESNSIEKFEFHQMPLQIEE